MNEQSRMNRSLLKEIVLEQKTLFAQQDASITRTQLSRALQTLSIRQITIITGIRRCGKSILLKQMASTLGFNKIHCLVEN